MTELPGIRITKTTRRSFVFGPRGTATAGSFTLIELLIALAVGSLLTGGIYGILVQQRNVHAMHQQVLEMRQNIRMAGFDPTGNAGAVTAEADLMRFTLDRNEGFPHTQLKTIDVVAVQLGDAAEDGNLNCALDAGEDANDNGRLDQGKRTFVLSGVRSAIGAPYLAPQR